MTPESNLERAVLLALSRDDVRLFRNTVAVGWVGQHVGSEGGVTMLRNARRNSFGLAVGSGDLIGWRVLTVTPEHVGKRLAVFTSLELKAPRGSVRPEQIQWHLAVGNAGGYTGIVRSVDEARAAIGVPPVTSPSY